MDKRKWEIEYEKYKNGQMDARIAELEDKFKNKKIKTDEYDELKKIKRIKDNLYKVTNVLEFKKVLERRLELVKEEMHRLDVIEEAKKKGEKLEKELDTTHKKYNAVKEQLKAPNLKKEEETKLKEKLSELNSELTENNLEYSKNHEILQDNKETKHRKYKGMSAEELKAKSFEIGQKISKCNMVASNLMKGLSWDSIEIKLDNWKDKKYTADKKITKLARILNFAKEKWSKIRNKDSEEQEVSEDQEEQEAGEGQEEQEASESQEEQEASEKQEQSLVEQSKFEEKHPRLAKVLNFVKEKWAKHRDKVSEKKEVTKETKVDPSNEDFKKYLREIAEKGFDQAKTEKIAEARRKNEEKNKNKNKSKSDEEKEI